MTIMRHCYLTIANIYVIHLCKHLCKVTCFYHNLNLSTQTNQIDVLVIAICSSQRCIQSDQTDMRDLSTTSSSIRRLVV